MTVKNRILCCHEHGLWCDGQESGHGGSAGLLFRPGARRRGADYHRNVMIDENSHYNIPNNMGFTETTRSSGSAVWLTMVPWAAAKLPSNITAAQRGGVSQWRLSAIPKRQEYWVRCPGHDAEEIYAFAHKMGQATGKGGGGGRDAVRSMDHRHEVLGTFLSPLSNKRVDDYGGSVDGRLRFLLEVIAEVRRAAGEDYPIIVRMSMTEFEPGGQSCWMPYHARRLEKAGGEPAEPVQRHSGDLLEDRHPNGTPEE